MYKACFGSGETIRLSVCFSSWLERLLDMQEFRSSDADKVIQPGRPAMQMNPYIYADT